MLTGQPRPHRAGCAGFDTGAGMAKSGSSGRMPKEMRRSLMLETAVEIVRNEGTEALTLAYLAERCGVTKPIAYQHFGTRAGLLVALYHQLGALQAEAAATALNKSSHGQMDIAELSRMLSTAFVDCILENGTHFTAISAALVASAETSDFRNTIRGEYIELYRKALAPLATAPPHLLTIRLTAFLGAAELLMETVSRGLATRDEAIETLSDMLAHSLRP